MTFRSGESVGQRRTIDLNADVGEATDEAGIDVERALLRLVTSVHIACGGHAGNEVSMQATVRAALACGVRIGAHPSYPDRDGFGRRPMEMDPLALESALRAQIQALVDVGRGAGTSVATVKAHGALYGEVAKGGAAFAALREAVRGTCPGAVLVLRSGSPAADAARRDGVAVWEEGFCDRAYTATGELIERRAAGAVLSHPSMAARQAVSLARDGAVELADGSVLHLRVDTLCVHGDSPGAVAIATQVRRTLEESGMDVVAPPGGP